MKRARSKGVKILDLDVEDGGLRSPRQLRNGGTLSYQNFMSSALPTRPATHAGGTLSSRSTATRGAMGSGFSPHGTMSMMQSSAAQTTRGNTPHAKKAFVILKA